MSDFSTKLICLLKEFHQTTAAVWLIILISCCFIKFKNENTSLGIRTRFCYTCSCSQLSINRFAMQTDILSHKTQTSHPELSVLESLSLAANKSLGMLSTLTTIFLKSLPDWILTVALPFLAFCTTKGLAGLKEHTPHIKHPQSATDHFRMFYT